MISWLKRLVLSFTLYSSDIVILQSFSMKKDFQLRYGHKYNKKIVVIYNGVDIINVDLLSGMEKPNFENGKMNFVLAGTLKKQKGYDILLEAVSRLDDNLNNRVQFTVLGEGSERDYLESKAKELNIFNVDFIGNVKNPYSYYSAADGLLLPSRYEGFSNTLVEAQCLGLPALVSRSPGGNEEVVNSCKLGMTFKNRDPEDLAKCIAKFVNSVESYDRDYIKINSRSRFSINNISSQYVELLSKMSR